MAVEMPRGCGYRKVGGLYLVGGGYTISCDRLPFELKECEVCGSGIHFTRGFQWINWLRYAGKHSPCVCREGCPICNPDKYTPTGIVDDKRVYGLLWVGESFYTPEEFTKEAALMGVSRRIAAFPRRLKLGETWVLFAHLSACGTRTTIDEEGKEHKDGIPGVFYAFCPQRVEKLLWESEARPEILEDLEKSNITPVLIPDGDLDHDPKTPLKISPEEREQKQNSLLFQQLRDKLTRKRPTPNVWDTEDTDNTDYIDDTDNTEEE